LFIIGRRRGCEAPDDRVCRWGGREETGGAVQLGARHAAYDPNAPAGTNIAALFEAVAEEHLTQPTIIYGISDGGVAAVEAEAGRAGVDRALGDFVGNGNFQRLQ